MNKFLTAVILGSILLVGVGFGSISLMQKSNAQQGPVMHNMATQQRQAMQQRLVLI